MSTQLVISNTSIRKDSIGRYSLNDLHKASGNQDKDKPANWLRSEKTVELIDEILIAHNREVKKQGSDFKPVASKSGRYGGTYVCKELVYSYAMWISAAFALKVIRAYDSLVTNAAKVKATFVQSTAKELTPLRQTAERLIATGVGNIYPDIWKYVHKEFGVEHINELLPEQIPQAISFLDALEGEYIPKQQLPQTGLENLAMPMSFFDDFDWLFEEENISKNEALSHADAYPRCMLKTAPEYPNPVGILLNKLQSAGVDVSAAQIQLRALRNHLRATIMQLDIASRKDTKTLLSNTNVAFNHLKAIREEWRTTLAPAIEKLNPNLEYEVTRRLAEMNGVIYANLMSLQGAKSGKLLA
ncbi:KilA-N domain-containing protein [Providencia rettgeri]